jgi:putative oxidoreductase
MQTSRCRSGRFMPADSASIVIALARLLLGGAFAFAGLRNFINRSTLTGIIAARGVPQAGLVLHAGIAVQVVAGLLVVFGLWTSYAAVALMVFLVAATIMFDNFWDHEGIERHNRINGVIANIALTGGFLLLVTSAG